MKGLVGACLAACMLLSAGAAEVSAVIQPPPSQPAAAASPLKREVFGFALAGTLADSTVGDPTWDFSLLSTVAFFGLHVQDDGTFTADSGQTVWNSTQLTDLVTMAHAKGTKVVLTIIKQDFAAGTPDMCAALANYTTTVTNTVNEVKAKGVDGVNVDYEGLAASCGTFAARDQLTKFVAALRAALPAPTYYLSIDTYASSAADPSGFFDIPSLKTSVDSFFVMAYDLEYSNWRYAPVSCSSFCLGPTSPLTGYHYNSSTTAAQYASVVPASQVILGVPYYGRKSCVGSTTPNQYPTSAVTADTYLDAVGESGSSLVQYGSYAAHRDANDPSGQERWDTWYNTSLQCNRELYWDDAISLGKKYALVNNTGLRGVGIWNLNYGGGSPELWCQLSTSFVGVGSYRPAVVTVAPSIGSAAGGTSVTLLGCGFSGATSVNFGTTAAAAFTVISDNQIMATAPAASKGVVDVTVTTSAGTSATRSADQYQFLANGACSSVTASASPATARAGASITITGSAACPNANALYEFWMLQSGRWVMLQGYSPNAAYVWNSTGAPAGTWQFGVWARDLSSSAAYDTFTSLAYTIQGPECQTVTVSASPASPQPAGTPVIITGSATGCANANPLFEFWMLQNGGWVPVEAYSTNASYNWNSFGAPAGAWTFGVWVRDAASQRAYDAFTSISYTVAASSCASVAATPAPASVAHGSGTHVTVTASASGCTSSPRYEFWIRAGSQGSWQLVQGYSASATYDWNSSGAAPGTVYFGVWVRDGNSTASYDAVASTSVTVT